MSGRKVTIAQIMDHGYKKENSDFILVNTVWNSGPPQEGKRSRFLFADENGDYIEGVLWPGQPLHLSHNVFVKASDDSSSLKIKNFLVSSTDIPAFQLLKNQHKRLVLSQSSLDVHRVHAPELRIKHLPFQFAMLRDIDNCPLGGLVDVIGVAKEISDVQKSKNGKAYRIVMLQCVDTFERELVLFENHMNRIPFQNQVYTFFNAKVTEWGGPRHRNKNLQATENTIALMMDRDTWKKLPPQYHDAPWIVDLLPGLGQDIFNSPVLRTSTPLEEGNDSDSTLIMDNESVSEFGNLSVVSLSTMSSQNTTLPYEVGS